MLFLMVMIHAKARKNTMFSPLVSPAPRRVRAP